MRVNRYELVTTCCVQSNKVPGDINLTCDAWQASNVDGYFATTAHWIETVEGGQWELRSALIGFVRLNNAHNGKRLGQALFKIVDRLGIAGRVGSRKLSVVHNSY